MFPIFRPYKRWLLALLVIGGLAACTEPQPEVSPFHAPGGTLADPAAQGHVMMLIRYYGDANKPNCPRYDVRDTRVTRQPINREWEEVWTVDRCGKTETYLVKYLIDTIDPEHRGEQLIDVRGPQ